MKGKLAPPPFDGYRVYDPIMNNEGRRSVTLVNIEGPHRTTLAYAKYLMSIEVGRWLERDEHVHHINGDCSDDRIENFEIVSRLEHVNRHPGKGPKMRTWICEYCGREFTRRDDGKYKSFCSREHSYSYLKEHGSYG